MPVLQHRANGDRGCPQFPAFHRAISRPRLSGQARNELREELHRLPLLRCITVVRRAAASRRFERRARGPRSAHAVAQAQNSHAFLQCDHASGRNAATQITHGEKDCKNMIRYVDTIKIYQLPSVGWVNDN